MVGLGKAGAGGEIASLPLTEAADVSLRLEDVVSHPINKVVTAKQAIIQKKPFIQAFYCLYNFSNTAGSYN
jgi:hypothetical protein